jgi:hypothetical protein
MRTQAEEQLLELAHSLSPNIRKLHSKDPARKDR